MARVKKKKAEAVGEDKTPTLPEGELALEPPPDREEPVNASNLITTVVPMIGSVGMMAFMAMSQSNNPRMLLMAGAMVFAMVAMIGTQMYRQISAYRTKVNDTRSEYLAYLTDTRRTVRDLAKQHYQYLQYSLPEPTSLVLLAASGARVWERRASGSGVLNVRLGVSQQKLSKRLKSPELGALAKPDVVCQSALARFVDVQSNLGTAPFGVYLNRFLTLELCGPRDLADAQLRAMIAHLAVMVPPTDLRIAVLADEDVVADWDWLKWLPHVRSEEAEDALGPARMVATTTDELDDLMGPAVESRGAFRAEGGAETARPHVLLIVDHDDYTPGWRPMSDKGVDGVTRVVFKSSWGDIDGANTLRLVLRPGKVDRVVDGRRVVERHALGQIVQQDIAPSMYRPDQMSLEEATAVARRLTRFTEGMAQATTATKAEKKASSDLMDLLGLGDVRAFDPDKRWRYRKGREYLRVPFGLTEAGGPVIIDIKESAKKGMGPHGMLIGATGSGKSEVLRTMVLAMALTHDPVQLNFVLVDFKGGATFAGMDTLPHVSAMISNLEEESFLVARMEEALQGEMSRRQELLRAAGNFAKVEDYENARRAGKHDGPPLPALFVIIDEFSELLVAHADFIKVFEAIGRLGRSLSVHLLFASQRIDTKAGDLMSHISYRIGLKTFSAGESRSIIGSDAAFKLPPLPGSGYLLAGGEDMVRFRASYVAAPPRDAAAVAAAESEDDDVTRHILPFSVDEVTEEDAVVIARRQPDAAQAGRLGPVPPPPGADGAPAAGDPAGPDYARYADMSQLDIAVKRMEGHGLAAHKIWLEPLDNPPTLDMLFGDLAPNPRLGLVSQSWREKGPLRVPMGMVDLPRQQKQETLEYDFSGAKGHGIVVGSPMTGKSTALRSLVMSLALTASPLEIQFYVLDFGGTFSSMRGLPHIAGIAARGDTERASRMLAEIEAILEDREVYFRKNGIDTMADYRRLRASGGADDGYGDVFLILDGWATFKEELEGEDRRLGRMMERALNYGVHLVVGAGRWLDLRMDIQPLFGTKIELRIDEESASIIDRHAKKNVPVDRPGRGLDMDAHQMLLTLPRIDGERDPKTLGDGVRKSIASINAAARGMHAPRLRLLPERVNVPELLAAAPALTRPMAELEAEYARILAEEAEAARAKAQASGQEIEPADEAPMEKIPVPLHDKCLVLGVEERRLGPLVFDPLRDQHLFLVGDGESGRSAFIRLMAHEIMRTNTPDEAQLVIVDPRRSLLGEVPEEYRLAYLTMNDDVEAELRGITSAIMEKRAPGDDVTVTQLRDRSWWSGPEIWVLVDDEDMMMSGMSNKLMPLDSLLAQARDVGLHVVIARRTGGAVMNDRVISKLRELGATGLLLSGSPDDGGVIGRVKAVPASPGRAQVVARSGGVYRAQLAWQPRSE